MKKEISYEFEVSLTDPSSQWLENPDRRQEIALSASSITDEKTGTEFFDLLKSRFAKSSRKEQSEIYLAMSHLGEQNDNVNRSAFSFLIESNRGQKHLSPEGIEALKNKLQGMVARNLIGEELNPGDAELADKAIDGLLNIIENPKIKPEPKTVAINGISQFARTPEQKTRAESLLSVLLDSRDGRISNSAFGEYIYLTKLPSPRASEFMRLKIRKVQLSKLQPWETVQLIQQIGLLKDPVFSEYLKLFLSDEDYTIKFEARSALQQLEQLNE